MDLWAWTQIRLLTDTDFPHPSCNWCTWLNKTFLCSNMVIASLLHSVNAGNWDSILLPQLQEKLKRERCKTTGHHPEDLLPGDLHVLFLASHSFSYFGPEVSLFRSHQGCNTPCLTFSLPFIGLTTVFSCISRFPGTLSSSITYLGVFLHTLGVLRHDSYLFCLKLHRHYCVPLNFVVSFSWDCCHLILPWQILSWVLIAGFSLSLWAAAFFPPIFLPYSSSTLCIFGGWYNNFCCLWGKDDVQWLNSTPLSSLLVTEPVWEVWVWGAGWGGSENTVIFLLPLLLCRGTKTMFFCLSHRATTKPV